MTNVMELRRETEAARELLKSIAETLGDDQELIETTIEGETGLMEALERAVNRIAAINALEEGIRKQMDGLKTRLDRLDTQRDTLRATVCAAMEIANIKRLELAIGTVTRKAVPPKVEVIAEEDIPAKYWIVPEPVTKLDKKLLLADLNKKVIVPGATLSNGGETISVRTV
jgi:ribosome-associated translation inhibitor RaiA